MLTHCDFSSMKLLYCQWLSQNLVVYTKEEWYGSQEFIKINCTYIYIYIIDKLITVHSTTCNYLLSVKEVEEGGKIIERSKVVCNQCMYVVIVIKVVCPYPE